ncbi:MAG: ABC transporter ATP-binding protein [Spirochaetaceae bacterium]|jgi:iron complex transport system ATP-binding protein|nr:ABC transporter ATP-binding protein [Spirochaetaceae bacterium]
MKQNKTRLVGERITFTVNGAKLLDDVNFEIEDGSFTGLIGPNGCGKTTLLKTVYRYYRPDRGAVYLDGDDIHRLRPKLAAQKMAALPQENTIVFDFPVMEMVMMARFAKSKFLKTGGGEDTAVCENSLKRLGLYEMRDRNFLSLSGGEKQRALLASVLAQETKFIILDEPANHLDIGQQILIMDAVKRLEETTVFASIHDLNLAARCCDNILAMKAGRIIASGPPEKVLTPALIRELFQVDARIDRDPETSRLHIRYVGHAGG